MSEVLNIIYIAIGLAILVLVLIFLLQYFQKKSYEKKKISRSLDMVLLQVFLPKQSDEGEGEKNQKEFAAKATQLLASLYSIKDVKLANDWHNRGAYLSFEIASFNETIKFYVGVPQEILSLVEKQINSIYPNASMEEAERYNIFKGENQCAAAQLKLSENVSLPIRTSKDFETDTLNSITNALSKLEKEEGAIVQFIIRPASNKWQKNSEQSIKDLREGKKITTGPLINIKNVAKSGAKLGGELARAATTPAKEGEAKPKEITPVGEQQIKAIGEKLSFVGFETTIRIVTSSSQRTNAKTHLSNIISAFSVFSNPIGNKLVLDKRIKAPQIIEDFIFRSCPYSADKNILNTEELASIFHFPNKNIETPNIVWLRSKRSPAPPETPKEGIFLGTNIYRGTRTPVYMKPEDRLRHVYVIGQTGSGKSTILKEMIMQDIKNGDGVCYIDPHGTDVEEILQRIPKERAGDVIYFNPTDTGRPLGLNLLEFNPQRPEEKTFAVNELMNVFDRLYDLKTSGGPMFEQYFRNAALLVMEHPESGSTIMEIPKVLADEDFRAFKLSKCQNPIIKNYWLKEAEKAGGEASLANVVPYVTSKLTQFIANDVMRAIIAQQKSAFNFREVMDNRKILLVNLSKGQIGEMNMSLLGLLVVSKIYLGTMGRADSTDPKSLPPFYLYIDEFHNFATESIAGILSEARKYKLSLNIAHQFIGQLDKIEIVKKAIFGNVGTRIIFRIDTEDAEFVEKGFKPVFNASDFINLEATHACIKLLADGTQLRPFSLNTRLDLEKVRSEMNPKLAIAIKKLSRLKYGRDRGIIEAEIKERA